MSDNKLANIGVFFTKLWFAGILVCFSCPAAFSAPNDQPNQSVTDASLNADSASQRGFLSALANGYTGSQVKNPYRIYDKGVSPADLEKNLDDFTEQALTAMDNNSVSPQFSSRDHDTDSLKKSWEWDFEVTSWGCEIQVNYEGDGNPIGELRNIVGCCDSECGMLLWLVTDTITYPFPVGFVDTSRSQLSSALRRHPAYLSGDKTGDSPTPPPSRTPPAARTPGKGGKAEVGNCNYQKAEAIASQGGYSKEYIDWVMSIGERESSFDDGDAADNTLNGDQHIYNSKGMPLINNNVAKATSNGMSLPDAQALYGDYGYYQNNAKDSQYAVSQYGLSEASALALSNNGGRGKPDGTGNYTVEEQTLAMAEYIKKKYPSAAAAAENGDYVAADEVVDNFWFGAGDQKNPCIK